MTILNISEVTGPVVTNFIGLRAEAQRFEAIFFILIIFSSLELAQAELLGYRDVRRTCGRP